MPEFKIGNRLVGTNHPTYFIAEISANHDGDLDRAFRLIELAKESGADCAKFQHFQADKIVSKKGFEAVGKLAHQAGWKESVYEAFERLSIPWDWTVQLAEKCSEVGIEFMSTPYDSGAVLHLKPYVNAYKVGSGDINNLELIADIARVGKPVLLGTGASTRSDVLRAVLFLQRNNIPICVMQCNTAYTGGPRNYPNLNLKVLQTYADTFPHAVLGLSDHTVSPGIVVAAVTLGARVVERHFTDNPGRTGPDHSFSLSPSEFEFMVSEVRRAEAAFGTGLKDIMENERETVILQRRCIRANKNLKAGDVIKLEDIVALRPAPEGSFEPWHWPVVVDRVLKEDVSAGDPIWPYALQ